MRSAPPVLRLHPRLETVEFEQLLGHFAVEQVERDIHRADPFALGAPRTAPGQVHGSHQCQAVCRRGAVTCRPPAPVAVAQALGAEAERADLAAARQRMQRENCSVQNAQRSCGVSASSRASSWASSAGSFCNSGSVPATRSTPSGRWTLHSRHFLATPSVLSGRAWSAPAPLHSRAGDADDMHLLALELRLADQSGQRPQVAPFDDDPTFPLGRASRLALERKSARLCWHPGEKSNCAAASAVTATSAWQCRHAGRRGNRLPPSPPRREQASRLGADGRGRRRIAGGIDKQNSFRWLSIIHEENTLAWSEAVVSGVEFRFVPVAPTSAPPLPTHGTHALAPWPAPAQSGH